ncbi:MAG: hypothetical protein NTU62_03200 [Spirochaetes bacterium]|nr:hypothetical protein [Spirochaetota bacterium]
MRELRMPGRVPVVRTTLLMAAWCVMGLALLTCTPPNFDDDPVNPVPTGQPLTIAPLEPEVTAGMSFTFKAAGGTSPYTYSVTGNGSINPSTGKYTAADTPTPPSATVTVTDYDDEVVSTIVIVHPSQLWMVPTNPVFEANTQYTFAGHGGTPPYYYTESGVGTIGYTSGIYSSPSGGTTTVTVTDSASVSVNTTVNVNPPVFPLEISPASAEIETGVFLGFSASGGKSPYTFSNTGVGSINSSTGLYSSGVTPGTATVKVTDDDGTFATASPITVNSPPPPLTISPSSATVILNGTQDFDATGGTPPYTFSKVSGVGSIGSSDGVYTSSVAGSAVVKVTDNKSRNASAPITVTDALGITPSSTSVTVNGTVSLVASGGISPYDHWDVFSGGGSVAPTTGPMVVYTAPGTPDTVIVRVTDHVSATADCFIDVTPGPLTISPASITLQVGNSVTFTAENGAPYTFSVASGVGSVNPGTGEYSSPTEGTAIVRVTDNYGRTQDASVTVNPPPLGLNPSSITIQAGGSVTFTAEGGTLPYTFSKESGVGSIGPSDGLYTSSVAGSAVVKVTDSKSRTDTATVTVEPPPAPPLNLSPVNVNVQTGSDQTFSTAGGTTPYTWDVVQGAAGGTVTSSGVYTAPASVPSSPTPYTVRVTDSATPTPTVRTATVNVYSPLEISPHPAIIDAGTQFTFVSSGGIPPRAFSMPSGGRGTITSGGLYTAPGTTGVDTVRVTDSQGKFTDWSFTVIDPATWNARQSIDSSQKSGQYASLALDASGNPQIAYWEAQHKDLKLARWTGSWSFSTIDNNDNNGDKYASLALDSDGHARVTWYDDGHNELRYREWNGGGWNSTVTVDTNGDVGQYSSLTLDTSGYPRIAYYNATNKDLKYAAWNGSSWSIETVDSTGDVGQYASLALNASSGYPRIAYYDVTNGDLKYAAWNGSSWSIETVDSSGTVGQYVSLKLNSSSYPCIAYYDADTANKNLKYAAWNGSSWDIATLDSTGDVGKYASLALNATGDPRIAYYDASTTSGNLKYASRTGSIWVIGSVDSAAANVGQYASIALAPSTYLMRIAYYDANAQDLLFIQELP